MYRASVVILNWNGEKFLQMFLPFLIKYTNHPDIELVVADNASTDGSVDFVKSNFPQIRLIILDKNYGFAGGYNKALEQVSSKYYILLNSDVEVTENWILPILDFMDQDATIGACMPKILAFHNRHLFEHAGASGGFIDKNGFPFCRGRVLDFVEPDLGQYNQIIPVFWATGACMFVRAEAFQRAGKLDARFFAHMEEIDLCWRMQWLDYKIYVYPSSHVFHVGGGALPKENPRKTYLNFRNNLFLLFKNLPKGKLFGRLFIRLSLDGLAAAQYLFKLKFQFFWAILKSHFHFYKHLKYLLKFRKDAIYLKNREKSFTGKEDVNILTNYYLKGCKKFSEIINNH